MRKLLTATLALLMPLAMSAQKEIATKDYSSVNSKSNDFGLSFNLDIEKKLARRLTFDLEGEFRTQDNTGKAERWTAGGTLQYKFFQTSDKKFNMKVSAGYTFMRKFNLKETTMFEKVAEHYDDDGTMDGYNERIGYKNTGSYWRTRHRGSLSLSGSYSPSKRWTISLKETFQYNHYCSTDSIPRTRTSTAFYKWRPASTSLDAIDGLADTDYRYATQDDGTTIYYYDKNHYGINDEDAIYTKATPDKEEPFTEVDNKSPRRSKDKWVLRSKLTVEYNIHGLPLNPYASIDYGCGLNYTANKWKYTVGAEYKLNKQNKIDFYYRFSHDDDDDEPNGHLIGVGYKYSF